MGASRERQTMFLCCMLSLTSTVSVCMSVHVFMTLGKTDTYSTSKLLCGAAGV